MLTGSNLQHSLRRFWAHDRERIMPLARLLVSTNISAHNYFGLCLHYHYECYSKKSAGLGDMNAKQTRKYKIMVLIFYLSSQT